ncbi:NAD(P)/FAD-dependent oxidoreductase [Streptomyces sp. SID339]|uniref:FAD-dependent oxidoreductase n=3 Tax=Streptomyces TaxID=1883 RepID=A0A5P2B950_STRVZ|nr:MULTISPECIES: FAD-dependent oxidoreductase [unclassified Streptomyces]MYZ15072.1 FAD-dependent oxidoreductase [Streptomyces sp. SID337]NEB45100.1 NAD(P)/FAD-dependent oxidoreductase [Streptomyces sp. SID339]QES27013.1 FAD-dependent oxidoreductase [Streptomyces venezuelae]
MTSSAQPTAAGTAPGAAPADGVVVIGTGLAGARVAQRLGAGTVLIGEENHAPYNRVLLAEVLAGRYGPDVIALPSPAGTVLRTRAVRIDRAERQVQCADGGVVPYGTLVLATGSNPVLPPLRGLFAPGARELPGGVHAFRTMDDCLALSAAVAPGVRVVVIGGGLLGVSAARALAVRGAQVVLTQQAERLMERQLDPASSELVRRHLTDLGVEVHTECRVRGVGVTDGAVRRVELADGYLLDTDVTVLACGVRPRTGLAQAAGLDVRRGVVVDDLLRTSDPHIRAVGDCAEHAGRVYGLATPAVEQADTLAAALGHTPGGEAAPRPYTGTRTLTRLTLPGPGPLDIAAFGDPEPRPDDDVVQLADATRGTYRKVVVRGGRLVGGVLLGELAAVGALARAWEADDPLPDDDSPLLHLLTSDGGR